MKYLKIFEELDSFKKELDSSTLRNFCEDETHLAYLLDEGFTIDLVQSMLGDYIYIIFERPGGEYPKGGYLKTFFWDNIKDYFIPFIHQLLVDHEIEKCTDAEIGESGIDISYFYIKNSIIDGNRADILIMSPTVEMVLNDNLNEGKFNSKSRIRKIEIMVRRK